MQGMYQRTAIQRLQQLAGRFPAVLIVGARQVGKTTLAQGAFARAVYLDLEEPRRRALFAADCAHQLEALGTNQVILDEAQSVPELFAALRGAIDARRARKGRYILLGSAQPALVKQVSESLTGRIGLIELDPLTAAEARSGSPRRRWQELWLKGGFPDALKGNFRDWWEGYLRLYIERDLPALGIATQPLLLRRLLTMLAHQQGQLVNASQLGASLGVSHGTVHRYVDILEQTFLIRRLPPFFVNIGKRVTKASKIYLRDTGLLHHLLNIESHAMLDSHPIRGPSWETFVIEDLIRREKLTNPYTQFFFWRTAAGAELDLVFERGTRRIAIEIKAASGRSVHLARSVEAAAGDIQATTAWVLDQASGEESLGRNVRRRNYADSLEWLP